MSRITQISTHLPTSVLSNQELANRYPSWTAEKIFSKTGISERRIASRGETAGDLALSAAQKLLTTNSINAADIDQLILVTQTPDQALPSTSCRIHYELGLSSRCGAFDLNQGCSGYIYGLAVADGMIASGLAENVLLLTADTYSKIIDPGNQSVATLFGDAACASLIQKDSNANENGIGPTQLGTDGSGGNLLRCSFGGWRIELGEQNPLEMDGPSVLAFTLSAVPKALREYLERNNCSLDDYDYVVFHQANKFILEKLYSKIGAVDKGVISMEKTGNTVSCTIPIALEKLFSKSKDKNCRKVLLGGFGVGLSWGFTSIMI